MSEVSLLREPGGSVESPACFAELVLPPASVRCHVKVSGELDLTTVRNMAILLRFLEETGRTAALDLAAVTFVDSSGLAPILDSMERRAATGQLPLTLTYASRPVLRLLRLLNDEPQSRALLASRTF